MDFVVGPRERICRELESSCRLSRILHSHRGIRHRQSDSFNRRATALMITNIRGVTWEPGSERFSRSRRLAFLIVFTVSGLALWIGTAFRRHLFRSRQTGAKRSIACLRLQRFRKCRHSCSRSKRSTPRPPLCTFARARPLLSHLRRCADGGGGDCGEFSGFRKPFVDSARLSWTGCRRIHFHSGMYFGYRKFELNRPARAKTYLRAGGTRRSAFSVHETSSCVRHAGIFDRVFRSSRHNAGDFRNVRVACYCQCACASGELHHDLPGGADPPKRNRHHRPEGSEWSRHHQLKVPLVRNSMRLRCSVSGLAPRRPSAISVTFFWHVSQALSSICRAAALSRNIR